MMQQPFPELSSEPMQGDAAIMSLVNAERMAREGKRATLAKPDETSVYTQVVEELVAFIVEMRDEFAKEIPAPFMKRKLSAEQIRKRVERMTAEERIVLGRKYGVRQFAEWAASHQRGTNATQR